MLAKVNTISNIGLDCQPVVVEADMSNGLPGFIVVGLANKSVEQAINSLKLSARAYMRVLKVG